MNETMTSYKMNPAEDEIRFGDELAEGMWVLLEDRRMRSRPGMPEDEQLRAQRFRRVTRLARVADADYGGGIRVTFVGEWVDGYQEVWSGAVSHAWLAKKAPPAEPEKLT